MIKKKTARKKRTSRIDKRGMAPGSIVFTGDRKMKNAAIHLVVFNETSLDTKDYDLQEIPKFVAPTEGKVTWYDIRGVHDVTMLETIVVAN